MPRPPSRRLTPSSAVLAAIAVLAPTAGCVIDELQVDDVGEAPYCEPAANWPREYAELEASLLERIATVRRQGRSCGDVHHNPVTAFELQPQLHCAARLHATFVAEHTGLSHEGQDGSTPLSRAAQAGYDGAPRYELLARDYEGAGAVLQAWLEDPQHCDALFDNTIREIGVGHSRSGPPALSDRDGIGWVIVLGERK
ncbi:MAG: hypothetical protein IPK74_17040 [Deltaproteobacteria bacterium]|nr:hypothetical protein [Deltaproteobacteria bacterium]